MKRLIFAGQSNEPLAQGIVDKLSSPFFSTPDVKLGDIYHHCFPSGEYHCQFQQNIRGADVFLVQSLNSPVNDNLMQLLVMADAARRASAGRLTAIIPYMGYVRSDRKVKSRTPIAGKLVIDMLECAGFDRIVTMDLHSGQAQGFTNMPFDNLYAFPLIINYLKKSNIENLCIVSPDIGGTKRAQALAEALGVPFAIVIKKRQGDTEVSNKGIVGDVKGKNVLIIDDMTESCGTLLEAGKSCLEEGALSVRAAVSHNLLTEVGFKRLMDDDRQTLQELIVTNTAVSNQVIEALPITILDSSEIFAKAIDSIHNNKSISELFPIKGF